MAHPQLFSRHLKSNQRTHNLRFRNFSPVLLLKNEFNLMTERQKNYCTDMIDEYRVSLDKLTNQICLKYQGIKKSKNRAREERIVRLLCYRFQWCAHSLSR